MNRNFRVLIPTVVATLALVLIATGLSSSAIRTNVSQRNGNLQITQFHHVVITGDDLRDLPGGENRVIQKPEGGDTGAGLTKSGAGRLALNNSNSNSSVDLNKTGGGTLTLPNASSSNSGLVKQGTGTLRNTPDNSGLTKVGTGTLILTSSNSGVVYEFRDVRPTEFGQIHVPADGEMRGQSLTLQKLLQQNRPQDAMKGWPFRRLLIGPANGIARVEGWKPDAIGNAPATGNKFVCTSTFCQCSGSADCLRLVDSGSCSSDMNCDGTGSNTKCYCKR